MRETFRKTISKQSLQRFRNNECPVCGKPKCEWNRRTDWRCCSTVCTQAWCDNKDNEYYLALFWPDIRMKAFVRDNFTCVDCKEKSQASKLCGDHIIPLALGGAEFDIENVQTLCIPCHKKKTKKDIAEIREAKNDKEHN